MAQTEVKVKVKLDLPAGVELLGVDNDDLMCDLCATPTDCLPDLGNAEGSKTITPSFSPSCSPT